MSDVKWIKITTSMFDDEKIRLIESMPDKDAILIIWIKLLVQAGKTNASGYIYLNENIPYTDEMLSTLFNRPLSTVRLAIKTFEKFGMIEIDSKGIQVTNWGKHQNIEGMDKIREQNRIRKQNQRDREKVLQLEDKNSHVTSRDSHATDIDIDKKKNRVIHCREIVNYLNQKVGTKYRSTTKKTQDCIKARENEGFKLEDFKKVIDIKAQEWLGTDMEKFLRPETLFGNKFEGYLNQKTVRNTQGESEHVPSYFKKFHYEYGD